ncbi:MAG: hypothetical protein ACLPN1_18950 [Dissulfurispiraceae bacterium]|jgi:hypothetical protein
MKTKVAILFCLTIFMVSCADKSRSSTSDSPLAAAPGKAETRALEAAGAVGYVGAGIRHSVDNALNQNDAINAETKKEMDQINAQ